MNFVFLMDPLSMIKMDKDTTFILMLESHKRGHKVYFLPEGGISRKNGRLFFSVTEVKPQQISKKPFILRRHRSLSEKDIDVVFIRTDPPCDQDYLINTWLLDLLPKTIPVINKPSGIRTVNEKLWATQFTSIIPRTFVGRRKQGLLNFLKAEKSVVLKPLHGYGGQGIRPLQKTDPKVALILQKATQHWTKDIILQQLLKEARDGDKRVLLLNGEPLGAMRRLHAPGKFLNNLFAGGKAYPADITKRDRDIIKILKPHLRSLGLFFVGIDIIGDYLIEVNVTSPTCLQEMNQLYGLQLEKKVIDYVEKLKKGIYA